MSRTQEILRFDDAMRDFLDTVNPNHEDKMSNPNTAEGLSPEEKIEEIAKELSPGHQQFVKDQIDNEWGYLISDIAQEHTAQTLDRLKEGVKELKDNACVTTIEGHRNRHNAFCEVLKLIEEVSDE